MTTPPSTPTDPATGYMGRPGWRWALVLSVATAVLIAGPPDGITLDAEGAVWTSMTLAHQFERITEGGAVTDRIDMDERVAIACALGGPERRTLFLLSSTDAYPQRLVGTRLSRLDAMTVVTPGAGLP